MSYYAKILSLSYDSAEASKTIALKSYWRSVRLLKESGTLNPKQPSYITNVLLCGNCIDPENRTLYVFYIDTSVIGSAWIIEINIDTRVQTVVYYDKYNAIGFNKDHKIYNARVVHGRIIWTDGLNPIFQIDIARAKRSFYHKIGYGQYPATTEWSPIVSYGIDQIVSNGNSFYKSLIDPNIDTEPRLDDGLIWKKLCLIEDAYYSMDIKNFYFEPVPPKHPPVVEYQSDEARKINNLRQTLFQVAYCYVYMDWRKSTYSPASIVLVPQAEEESATGLANEQISLNNKLQITVNSGGEEVRAIEIIGRSSKDVLSWFLIDTINKFEQQERGKVVSKDINAVYDSVTLSIKTPTFRNASAPPAPVATAGTLLTSTSFYANWEASAGASGYFLDVSTDVDFTTYVTGYHNRDMGNVTTAMVRQITSNTTYYFRVRSYNIHDLVSSSSNIITVILVLAAPVALEATDVFETGMTANWQAVDGATGYYLDVAEDVDFTSMVVGYDDLDVGNVLSKDIVGLTIDESYFYRVRAYNALGTSANSNTTDQRTMAPPSDPVATAASVLTLTSFTANWEASTGVTSATGSGYLLDVATDAGFVNKVTGYDNRFVGNVLSYVVRILSSNTTYYYRIRAINAHGVMSVNYSNIITALTLLNPPVALEATGVFETGMTANWSAVTGATGYYLDVSTVNTFATFVAGYNNLDVGNVVTHAITGLTINTSYFYRIRAYTGAQTSVSSNTTDQRTMAPPADPIAITATGIALTQFYANWNASLGATGYYLDVATDSAFASKVTGYDNRDVGNVTTFIVRILSSNTKYYYRIKAYNAHGILSNYSNIQSVTTLISAPVALSATGITGTGFTANWSAVTGAAGYYLDVSTVNTFASFVPGYENKSIGSAQSAVVTGLAINTSYFYRVRAASASSTSANSNIINQRTMDAPPVPVATAATNILATGFTANWGASVGASGYYLDVSEDIAFGTFVTGYENRDVGNVTSLMVRSLDSDTTYYYRVRAYDLHGLVSASSNIITVATLALVGPPAPVLLSATAILSDGFTANWNASVGATGYRIDVSTQVHFTSFVSGYNNLDVGNVTSVAIRGLAAGTVYYYRVRAYNANGTSDTLNYKMVTTLAAPALTLSISPSSIIFGGQGSAFRELITVTTNADSWYIDFPSTSNYIHLYNYISANTVEIYYDGAIGTADTVEFVATRGAAEEKRVTFTGRYI